jgi:hypothetical protein
METNMEADMAKARNGSSKSGKSAPRSAKGGSGPKSPPKLITATIDAATGKIVDVRSAGDAQLSMKSGDETLEELFEEAFEAGIACVLGEDAGGGQAKDSKADAALRRQILRPMIQHSAARRLMRQGVLGRAIVGTLIRQAGANAAASSRTSPTSPPA